MRRIDRHNPLYAIAAMLMIVIAIVVGVAKQFVVSEWLEFRPVSMILSVLAGAGLLARRRRPLRTIAGLLGGLVALTSCVQLAAYVAAAPLVAGIELENLCSQGFAAGMFCIGLALGLDRLLPRPWGRHLLFGILGALAGLIGGIALLVRLGDPAVALDTMVFEGLHAPGASVLVLGGLALLLDARLRASVPAAASNWVEAGELKDRSGLVAALTVLALAVGASLLSWRQAHDQAERQMQADRDIAVQRFGDALTHEIEGVIGLLRGTRGLFAASTSVEPDEWLRYFDPLWVRGQYPGLLVVAYAVRTDDWDSVARVLEQAGGTNIRPWQATPSGQHLPTLYFVPSDETTRAALGLDMLGDPVLAVVAEEIERSDQPAISGRVEFARFGDPEARIGFVIGLELDNGESVGAGRPPRIGKEGLVYAALDLGSLARRVVEDTGLSGMELQISDLSAGAAGEALLRTSGFEVSRKLDSGRALELLGHRWNIGAQFAAQAPGFQRSAFPRMVLGGGLAAALVLFALTWILSGMRARAMDFAQRVNRELAKAQRAQRAVTDTATVGIITTDAIGRILYLNRAAAVDFGVTVDAGEGMPIEALIPACFAAVGASDADDAGAEVDPASSAAGIERVGLRKDGSTFPVEVRLSRWASDGEEFVTAIVNDISRRKQAARDLEQRARDLERSNADLEQFAYVASHDLQEPLRMVASYVQLLAKRYRGKLDTDADEFIEFAVDGARRMQKLIEDLLAYSRVGRSGLEMVPTDLRECALRAVLHLQDAIARNGATVEVDCEGKVMAIPAQLVQVLQNLIGNALKFRGERAPRVVVSSELRGGSIHVRVSDNGIGIEARHQERVFAIFQRLHTRSEYEGTGIGLAICRRIIESFGGRIGVESSPGEGSSFHFNLAMSGESA